MWLLGQLVEILLFLFGAVVVLLLIGAFAAACECVLAPFRRLWRRLTLAHSAESRETSRRRRMGY